MTCGDGCWIYRFTPSEYHYRPEALTESPDSVDISRLHAGILNHLGRKGEALAILEQLIEQHPDDWKLHYSITFLLHSGVPFLPSGSYTETGGVTDRIPRAESERRLMYHRNQVVRLAPDSAEALFLRAGVETDPQQAIELLSRALELIPDLGEALLQRSYRHLQIGDFEAMLLDAERVTAQRSGWAHPHAQRGNALRGLGRHTEAELAFSKAIERAPKNALWWHKQAREGRTTRWPTWAARSS